MKTKPILIVAAVVIVIAGGAFFFIHSKNNKPGKNNIKLFLNAFNAQVKAGNIDSASNYFEADQKNKLIKILLSVLTNKTNTGGKAKPIFKVSLNTDDASIDLSNPDEAIAKVGTVFTQNALPSEKSVLIFTIHKIAAGGYKISQVNATRFVKDYATYQVKVINKTTPEADIYSPQTLAAFKVADKLKTKYDSVLWFDHVGGKTFYYVMKGKIADDFYWPKIDDLKGEKSDLKMGLVSPELKEIIPVEYDLIHNIGGTIAGLIEVEKGGKRGFYNVSGRLVLPADYEQIYPLKNTANLALLKKGEDYFYLKTDSTVSEKIVDLKIADVLPDIKTYGDSYEISEKSDKNIMEYNSRDKYTSLVITPSYLTDWNILDKFMNFQNPLRKLSEDSMGDGDGSRSLSVKFSSDKKDNGNNWFQSAFYTVVDDYIGGRGGLYTSKNVLLVDNKHNQIVGFSASNFFGLSEGGGSLDGACAENSLKAINDSLFEFKTTSEIDLEMLDSTKMLAGAPYYHYLQLQNGKLVALKSKRLFPTQFVKMDDSYLQNCYVIDNGIYTKSQTSASINYATKEILQLMKNEIYASYKYKFKNPRWNAIFDSRFDDYNDDKRNASVDDSLTVIDKYNIAFINNKLNSPTLNVKKVNALASR
ncbi:YARHG domain-containing protein [Mucilaginibacter sp. FT3.2]|uniref:YARHG domain-containing protein n=1 Tax=Mucilaginibacter sp. FT3.2 TaxID=2723090 RepID=UPI001615E1A7|nr:YARHG domain-containing protein [Mucilaginibacter sp. FT3.2]MBB6230559.1 hypothetical protein [Mucilaginibacter sp. FT3.2]